MGTAINIRNLFKFNFYFKTETETSRLLGLLGECFHFRLASEKFKSLVAETETETEAGASGQETLYGQPVFLAD